MTVAVVTVGLVIAPPERRPLPIETQQVQLAAVLVSAIENSATPEMVASPAGSELISAVPAVAAVAAAEGDEETFWDSPLGTVLLTVNFLLLPLWFLATPITLPLSMVVAAGQVTIDGPLGTLQWVIALGLGFLTGPLGLLAPFVGNSASSAAAEVPDAGRAGSAEDTEPSPDPAPVIAADNGDLTAAPADARRVATGKGRGSRLLERQTGRTPSAAAVVTTTASNAAATEDSSTPPVDEGPESVPVTVAEPALSSAADASNPKSRATSRSRR